MANSRDYRNPNYTEKIKLQRFFTQLQIAASFFKEHFVGKIMYYETEIESVELHFYNSFLSFHSRHNTE